MNDITLNEHPLQHKARARRFWELDFLRGFCVLLMLLDHTIKQISMFTMDAGVIASLNVYFDSPITPVVHFIIRSLFFVLCGISCRLSRSNAKRGLQMLGVACALTVATYMLDTTDYFYNTFIIFGVFYLLGIGVLVTAMVQNLCKHIPKAGAIIPAVLGVLWLIFYYAFIRGKKGDSSLGIIPALFGFTIRFASADYVPLFPHLAYVLFGSSLGVFYQTRLKYSLKGLYGRWAEPCCLIGRHALLIYLAQPILIGGLCYLIF